MEHRVRFTKRVSARVAAEIKRSGLSRARVAELSGIPAVTFHRRMHGVNPWDTDQLARVADALRIDPYNFFTAEANRGSDEA